MFDLKSTADYMGDRKADCDQMYIPASHTNRQPIKNTIGVVVNRLVGVGLKQTFFL